MDAEAMRMAAAAAALVLQSPLCTVGAIHVAPKSLRPLKDNGIFCP